MAVQKPRFCELVTHRVSQHERKPPHGSFSIAQAPPTRQRPSVVSHELLQQSASFWHRSPSARQKFMKAQRPVDWPLGTSQKPEQQLELPVQLSPSVVQPLPRVTQVPPPPGGTQLSSQQSALTVQLPLARAQLPAVEQTPPVQ